MTTAPAYFDSRVDLMATNREAGTEALCYTRQVELLESLLRPDMVVLDVGCGPALPYDTRRAYAIGLDPSAASLAENTDVDERIVGTAENIPLPDASIDLVVALYSLHHMTGQSPRETHRIRARALTEMERVLRPGGELLIFEMAPTPLARLIQWALWPLAKRLLGDRLDAYFWGDEELANPYDSQAFDCSPFETFPPILSLPWLRIPRCLFPFDAALYRWKKET